MRVAPQADEFRALPPPWDRILPFVTRLFIWSLLFGIVYFLRSFFLLMFLTFVFSYIQSQGVNALAPYLRIRALRCIAVGLVFLGIVVGLISFLAPRAKTQAQLFANNFSTYVQTIDRELGTLSTNYPLVRELVPDLRERSKWEEAVTDSQMWDPRTSPTAAMLQELFGFGGDNAGDEEQRGMRQTIETLRNVGGGLLGVISAFLLSLLFSFLIVLDLPRLSASVRSLGATKLSFIYHEAAGNILDFGRVLGRALGAQVIIAAVNMMLTASGLYFLGLEQNLAFLSVLVFLCSFIPVAGVFISSVPICIIALQSGGFPLLLAAIAFITVVHIIEAYILNPRIYGSHLRMNPVLVLMILVVGGKLFHVWGLVLGVPICTYVFGHAIKRPAAVE